MSTLASIRPRIAPLAERNNYATAFNEILKRTRQHIKRPITVQYRKSRRLSGVAYVETATIVIPQLLDAHALHVALHELGHLWHGKLRPSCLAELRAEQFATAAMAEFDLPLHPYTVRFERYYVAFSLAQALNRGIKVVPAELEPYRQYLKSGWTVLCARPETDPRGAREAFTKERWHAMPPSEIEL